MSVRVALRERQNAAFADYIADELARRNWTMAEFIRKAEITATSAVRNVLTGKSRGSPKTLEKLARTLEVEPAALATLYTRRPPKGAATPAAKEVTSTFTFALLPNGLTRLAMDLRDVPLDVALKVLDLLKAAEIFTEGA